MSDERLNTTIDEVARQMTEGAPGDGAAFRRASSRGSTAQATPRAALASAVRGASPLAAAIVIAVVVTRSAGRTYQPAVRARTDQR